MITELKENYGHLFEDELLSEINQVGTFKEIPEGFKMMEIGDYIKAMPLLVSGAIKIIREDNDGDELLLYFLEKGDTCAMTLTCCLGQAKSEIRAIAETDAKLIMIPVQKMEEWAAKYKSWRNFVFQSYHNRLNEMLDTIDSIAFLKMDERLLKYLNEKARVSKDHTTIHNTHQEIAYELHTSRVVVSRLLKKLENLGKIELHRNHIIMRNKAV
jgi:CRP/FNR family transcriptional regulator